MEHKPAMIFLGLLLLTIITACAPPENIPPPQNSIPNVAPTTTASITGPVHTPTEAAIISSGGMPVAGPGACANAYYPVREGSMWAYQSTGSPAGVYSFTDTITPVRNDGFTLTSKFDNLTRTQEWSCGPNGLVALQLGGGALTSQNLKLEIQAPNISGVSIPVEIKAGDQWDYVLGFTGKMDLAGSSGAAEGSDKSHFNALGMESVTVPAGTFTAMKIQVDTTLDINVTVQGVSVPVTFSSSYIYWYVQGAGWVKASGTGNIGGDGFSETIELQWYNIP